MAGARATAAAAELVAASSRALELQLLPRAPPSHADAEGELLVVLLDTTLLLPGAGAAAGDALPAHVLLQQVRARVCVRP